MLHFLFKTPRNGIKRVRLVEADFSQAHSQTYT